MTSTIPHILRIDSRTWTRDSHGLFDYETTDYVHNTCFLEANGQLLRQTVDGKVIKQRDINNTIANANNELLLTVNKTNGKYKII